MAVPIEPVVPHSGPAPGLAPMASPSGARSTLPFRGGREARPFNLIRRFAVLSLLSIGLVGALSAVFLSRFLIGEMLHRDAVVTMQFIQSITQSENLELYFRSFYVDRSGAKLEEFFQHIANMPDVVRANAYAVDRSIAWSSNPAIVGSKFDLNPELEEAFAGRLTVESEIFGAGHYPKPEHVFLTSGAGEFVENYIPVWSKDKTAVIGVVEVYKYPGALLETIHGLLRWIWIVALASGLFLFATLFWVVRSANRLILRQEKRLVMSETFAAIGDMAAAVAHSIRNPLASIRSSAELSLEAGMVFRREQAQDIIDEVDRLEDWVRELLTYAQSGGVGYKKVPLGKVVAESLSNFSREIEKQNVRVALQLHEPTPVVGLDSTLLSQILNSLIANAVEAMPEGGTLKIRSQPSSIRGHVGVSVSDTGVGMSPEQIEKAFVPFRTTKKKGLGVGLSLVRRVVERLGGSIRIASQPGKGTSVNLDLPIA
jgi:two-component system, NtrC family, sensor histidine kinase HydH